MPLDMNKIKRSKEATARGGGGNYFKCQNGKNRIRVFPFDHKVTKADIKNKLFKKDKLGKTVTELDRPVSRAFGISKDKLPVLLRTDADVAKAKALLPKDNRISNAFFINVVDTNDVEGGMREFSAPKTVYHGILGFVLDEEYGEDILGPEGRDFIIEFDKGQHASSMYSVHLRKEGKSEELPESLLKDTKDFYDEDVYSALGGTFGEEEPEDEDDDELGDDEDSKDEDDLGDEDDADLEETEEDSDEDSDEDESDDEEVDERPAKKKGKKKAPLAKKGKAKKSKKRR